MFLEQKDGDEHIYSVWKALQKGKRITKLHADDPDLPDLEKIKDADEKKRKKDKLLLKRNSQLQKCIQMIAYFLHYTEVEDVIQRSTSIPWIWNYLRQHYNIESKGVHFLKVAKITPQTFYRKLRAAFLDNLRKQGDVIKHDDDKVLQSDEKISPTLEQTIVLWALMMIDKRLPDKVDREFGHLMVGNTTLADLQVQIFQKIPNMLKEMDEVETRSAAVHFDNPGGDPGQYCVVTQNFAAEITPSR